MCGLCGTYDVPFWTAADCIEKYVKSAIIHYGEIPFIYRVFEPTSVRSKKEKSGYKVVSPPLSPPLNQTHHR